MWGQQVKNSRNLHRMKLVCGMVYAVCLCTAFGLSIKGNDSTGKSQGKENIQETAGPSVNQVEDAVQYVSGSVNQEPPKIAITFDDGPSSLCTPELLDGLKERDVKATFFLIGQNAEKHPDIVKRLDDEGHLIGNHTYHHVEITKVSNEEAYKEITDTNEAIYKITGKTPEYMRPPFGLWQRNLELDLEVLPVMWTIDPLDWTTENVDEIVNKVVTEAEENDIILLHDCYKTSVEAALKIIDTLKEKGFEFVTVDELILN